jgi:hypothetical protein
MIPEAAASAYKTTSRGRHPDIHQTVDERNTSKHPLVDPPKAMPPRR